ncbi:MAG: OmpH family outer membrane protein [Bacteroidales bacterium]|nr:OmpH family outer membrane protein [Bacteroidales bacterium]
MKKLVLIAAMALVSAAAFAQKFAHVNFNELIYLMPEAEQANATMAAAQNEAQEVYQSMMDEYQKKVTEYQQKSSSWTQAIRESKEKEINDVQQRIMEFEQSIQQELSAKQNELMAPIVQKAQETVTKIAKQGGYIYVFDMGTALYIDETQSTNITREARRALNISDDKTLEALAAQQQAQAQAQQ